LLACRFGPIERLQSISGRAAAMSPDHPLRGPLFMVLSTASYVTNDTMMKLATEGLPPYQVLVMRGISATIWGLVFLGGLRLLPRIGQAFHPRVMLRNLLEMTAVLGYIVALANMQIADVMALGQITPLVVLLGASFLFGERLGWLKVALIGLGFVGALMVAQPGTDGISIYALLALSNALFGAARDIASRRVPGEVPGLVVAFGASFVVLCGAGVLHLLLESWVTPEPRHVLLMGAAGLFLFFGHYLLFMAYRIGPTGAVAPFYYFFTFWAVVSGLVVFGDLPNPLALFGIVLIVASGVAVVLAGRRQRRLIPVA
jgi:drug/metabolite transporter (DMT)-like permease